MTTPCDDIAGISERLRAWGDADLSFLESELVIEKIQRNCAEAATQLDSLLKERDALQAKNTTLRAKIHNATEGTSAATKQAIEDELRAELAIAECLAVEMEARALRAEQERDALQARVKELEREVEAFHRHEQTLRDNGIASHTEAVVRVVDAEARALRAEQERDEAYERAAKVAEAMPWFIHTSPKHVRGIKGADVAAAIRRLAGPEKEGE